MKKVLSCAIIVVSLPQQLIPHMVWKILYNYNTNLLPHSMMKKADCRQDYLNFCWHDYQDSYLDNIIESMAFPNLAKNNLIRILIWTNIWKIMLGVKLDYRDFIQMNEINTTKKLGIRMWVQCAKHDIVWR
jgi:hypothetical protein